MTSRIVVPAVLSCITWLATFPPIVRAGESAPQARAVVNETALAKDFATPPDSARPWVYWFFMDGNLTREGITRGPGGDAAGRDRRGDLPGSRHRHPADPWSS